MRNSGLDRFGRSFDQRSASAHVGVRTRRANAEPVSVVVRQDYDLTNVGLSFLGSAFWTELADRIEAATSHVERACLVAEMRWRARNS